MILKRYMEYIEKKMEELCIAMKNTKANQIKVELQLVSLNETITMNMKKIDMKKTKLLRMFQRKHLKLLKRLTN